MTKICIADTFHIHGRNFPTLFQYFAEKKFTVTSLINKENDNYKLINCTGFYDDLEERVSNINAEFIRHRAQKFLELPKEELFEAEAFNIRLWPICRSELLAYLLSKENWQQDFFEKSDEAIFNKAYAEDKDTLVLNMAAANYWMNSWFDRRKDIFSNKFCFSFSGSMIYVRSLLELLRRSPTKSFLLESTFTGNDYILDELYHPLPNNLSVKYENARKRRRPVEFEDSFQYEKEILKAHNKIHSMKNKNVVQPASCSLPRFPDQTKKKVLIVGQVANDFSLIEAGFPYIGSIPVYKKIIKELLKQTDHNIIFKSHPWENKKTHLRSPLTFNALAELADELPQEEKERFLLVEDVNLADLIEESDYFVTFCSQSAFEAAIQGLKPFVLGETFFSNAGFTYDCKNIDEMIEALRKENGLLDLDECNSLNNYLVDFMQCGTISVFPSGKRIIHKRLSQNQAELNLSLPNKSELSVVSTSKTKGNSLRTRSNVLRKKEKLLTDTEITPELLSPIILNLTFENNTVKISDSKMMPTLEIINETGFVIPSSIQNIDFMMSYHVFDENGDRYQWNGLQTKLPQNIHYDINYPIAFEVPKEAGKYTIVPGLLLPGKFWINSENSFELIVEAGE